MNKSLTTFAILVLSVTLFSIQIEAQSIAGYSTLELTKPVTKEQKVEQRKLAKDSLSSAINKWVDKFFPERFDSTSSLSSYFKIDFINSCLANSKEYSVIRGHTWSIEFAVENSAIDSIIAAKNRGYDSIAISNQKLALKASENDQISEAYKAGINALIYSTAHMGVPLESPSGGTITEEMRKLVQSIMDRLTINFEFPIIIGTPLMRPGKPVTVQINTDTILISDFTLSGYLANGEKIITVTTNNMGSTNLNELKIPFVNISSFLYIRPDFAKTANLPITVTAKELGLKHTEDTEQTLIFKITDAKYSIHYKLIPTGISDIPDIFRDNSSIKSFLNDSLPLTNVATGEPTDLLIDISNRVVSKTYPLKASRIIKTDATITINNLKSGTAKVIKTVVLKEQEFDTAQKLPAGLYFWECSKTLRTEIKKMLVEIQKL